MGKNVSFWAWMKDARFFILQFLFERNDKEILKILFIIFKNFFNINERLIMNAIVDLYSKESNEIKKFIDAFFENDIDINNNSKIEIIYKNPVHSSDIISAFIDNIENFKITMWVSLDEGLFINVNKHNADKIIRYLFERYPY